MFAMKGVCFILCLLTGLLPQAQQAFVFTRFTTDDNMGLSSNVVYTLHQDAKGYIWVGTANGLQRFDGSKFIQLSIDKPGNDPLPYSPLDQIIPLGDGRLLLNFVALHEFGIFNPANLIYTRIAVKLTKPLSPKTDYRLWRDSEGEIYLSVMRYGVLRYNKTQNAFVDDHPFPFPPGYVPNLIGFYDDAVKRQVWFACDSGLCVYDRQSKRVWYEGYNPKGLPILKNKTVQDFPTQIYIDHNRRFWIFGWPGIEHPEQKKWLLDSNGRYLTDTTGLLSGPKGYHEYTHFFETPRSGLWIYGVNTLYNWDGGRRRFHYTRSTSDATNNTIEYTKINQLIEDRDGNLWMATDRGLYFSSYRSGSYAVINILFDESKREQNIEDMLEMPGREFWLACWGPGVVAFDSLMMPKKLSVYNTPPPADWPEALRGATKLCWTLFYQRSTGDVWIGCQGGVIMVHNPQKGTTRYLWPPEVNRSTIRFITEDRQGNIWISTQGGRLVKWDGKAYTVVLEVGNIMYKIFVDREGLLWLSTQDKGLYCVNPQTEKLIKHYTADGSASALYSNAGRDIEQLNDSIIVYGAGALNFVNKRSGTVRQYRHEDGLPSNSVQRIRMDGDGFLWIITSNGLCRYNPFQNRITTYGRKDGIVTAASTIYADLYTSDKYMMFGGGNAVMMFKPSGVVATQPPPDVIITDFKIFNQFIPADSLMGLEKIKLSPDQNSISIYFSSLSYQQRDRLTYFFKMEGIDKDWQAAEGVYFQNYSLLPPGSYTFKVYAMNEEGLRSAGTTELRIVVRPPFYRSKWFISAMVFLILLVTYFLHRERVNRLLAVEKIRNRVARDLHDDMGSTLSTINILSAMAKSKMATDPVKTAGYISKISDNSQRMMEAMDDIVWSIKPSNDTMQRVSARMREFATGVLEAKDIALKFDVDETVFDVKLNMEARRDFFLIFKEALNNAAKYSKATEVTMNVGMQNKALCFSIKDNGIGFDVPRADGNGLGNMQKRADSMNGKLRIRSGKGEGTEVRLTVPVGS